MSNQCADFDRHCASCHTVVCQYQQHSTYSLQLEVSYSVEQRCFLSACYRPDIAKHSGISAEPSDLQCTFLLGASTCMLPEVFLATLAQGILLPNGSVADFCKTVCSAHPNPQGDSEMSCLIDHEDLYGSRHPRLCTRTCHLHFAHSIHRNQAGDRTVLV